MKHLAPACFRAFACAAGSCPDSCCRAGWEIVPDEETLKLYQKLPGAEGARARAGIVPGAEPLLRQDSERVCVLLDPDGLCCVQKHFGHAALCKVCREYPRFRRDFGSLTEHGVSLSCPTAYALAVGAPPAWEEWEDEAPVVPNELDPEAYPRLRRGRELALDILTREELPLWQRVSLVRKLAAAMQAAPERLVKHDYSIRLRRWSTVGGGAKPPKGMACAFEHSSPARSAGPHWGPGAERACDAPQARFGTLARAVEGAGPYYGVTSKTGCRDKHCLSGIRNECNLPEANLSDATWDRLSAIVCFANADKQCLSLRHKLLAVTPYYGVDGTLAALARRFLSLEILSPAWKDALERFAAAAEAGTLSNDVLTPAEPELYARWLWYELYKYWLDALDDGELLGRVDRALAMLLLGMAMDAALPGEGPFLQRVSREIEHCEENLKALLAAAGEQASSFGLLPYFFS